MRRRRVLVNALSVTRGGARSYAINLMREFDRKDRGFDVVFLVPPGELQTLDLQRVQIRTQRVPTRRRSLRVAARTFYELAVLPAIAREYDLVYCFADMAPPICPVPVVMALRNLNIYDRRFYPTARIHALYALARAAAPRAARIVFPTRAAADAIAPMLSLRPERVSVVHHGIDASAFHESPAARPDVPYVFLPAAVERHKNMEVLIRAMAEVQDPHLEAWIAGHTDTDPTYHRRLLDLLRDTGTAERVRLLGPTPYETIMGLYRGAVAFVFPSKLETFGHPMLEAMLAGAPIVASDIPAFREIAGDVASYFDPDDPKHLAAAIDHVQGHPDEASARASRGRERVRGFSWQRSVDELSEVFRSVLDGRR